MNIMFEEESAWKPYMREDYEAARVAFKNMVALKIIRTEEALRRLRILREMTHEIKHT